MRTLSWCVALATALYPVPAAAQSRDVPVRLMLFGDVTYTETQRDLADGFSLGQVVGHMNASLSPRLLVFLEGTLSPTDASPAATLERVIVRYDHADWLKLSAGRYHTPVAWWNTAYHHGSWLHTSISRPRAVAFGTWLVPIHFLGVLAEGALHTGSLIVAYEVGAGNGRQDALSLPGDAGDDDGHLAVLGGLRLRSLAVPGAELGANVYVDEIGDPLGAELDERIYSAHVAVQRGVELLAEYVLIRHETPRADDAFDTHAWWLHVGYRLPGALQAFRTYLRYERIEPAAADPVFDPPVFAASPPDMAYDAVIAGIRWDFSTFAALKAEYRHEETDRNGAPDDGGTLLLNASFVIPNLLGGGAHAAEPVDPDEPAHAMHPEAGR